ncbi:MAG: hypothetical protein CMH98_00160, partial [Oceanospirillaceae bacterium]|nr:hypothetical protein [Oceanospirillaceae bacterium]
ESAESAESAETAVTRILSAQDFLKQDFVEKTDMYFEEEPQRVGKTSLEKFLDYMLENSVRQDKNKNTYYYFNQNLPREDKHAWKKLGERDLGKLYGHIKNAWEHYQTYFEGERPNKVHRGSWKRRFEYVLNISLPSNLYKCKLFRVNIRDAHCNLPSLK